MEDNKKIIKEEKELLKVEKKALKKQHKQELREVKKESGFLDRFKKSLIRDKINKKKEIKKEKHKKLNEPPKLHTGEEIGNSITHGVGALFGTFALVIMILKASDGLELMAGLFYGVSIIFLMTNSCLYHAFKSGLGVKRLWRRFDYLSIYFLIGGTFAPLFLSFLGGTLGIVLFCVQWGVIIAGATIVSVFGPGRFKWIHFTLYFVIGWIGILFIPYFIKHNISLMIWILVGGAIYTLGMIPFAALKNKKYSHFLWHFFVLLGCFTQWLGIFMEIYLK